MKIAVMADTGTAGRPTVEELEKAGHQVVGLSRSIDVDLTTDEGFEDGLRGADVCVDVSMPMPATWSRKAKHRSSSKIG